MTEDTEQNYKVLARKYRPQVFADLVGQDAMVRTLKNAFEADRIAQAFILTGIRGTGKTSTARIIAKGLNCIGPDGAGGPTTEPCGVCEPCQSIGEGRHVDVLEMDAASRTGVNDIREIIESVHYRAASARFKIYIIDEVHMLSTSAFNALLKTLEEPPAHVKFIFATTEIRKVPVTVLSRCQRFDLRRIEAEDMIGMLRNIAEAEKAEIADAGLALIARASEGSARDAISLLDQAISHGAGETSADQVRAMIGLADRSRILDLFEKTMAGDAAGALTELSNQYADGADPAVILRDLAEVTHWISVVRITPEAGEDPTISPDERDRGQALSKALPMRALTRAWQMLLKSIEEVNQAPNAMMAAEMAIIRLTHVADLPSPEDLVRKLQSAPSAPATPSGGSSAAVPSGAAGAPVSSTPAMAPKGPSPGHRGTSGGATAAAPAISEPEDALVRYQSFDQVVALIRANRDVKLLVEVETCLRLVAYSPGRIEFEPTENADPGLAAQLARKLQAWTGVRWGVSVAGSGGGKTIAELRDAELEAQKAQAAEHPLTQAVMAAFPDARITAITSQAEIETEAAEEALPEVEDEWDPFEDD